jgi:hypothetical protein
VTRGFTWIITPLALQYLALPIPGNPLVNNVPYTQPLLAIGGTGAYTWTNMAAMPAGLALDSSTGFVSGTPSNSGFFRVPIQVADEAGNTIVRNVSLSIAEPTAAIVP